MIESRCIVKKLFKMSRAILVGAFVLFLGGFLVSGAPTKKETNSDLHIEKDNHHHEFDLG